jgi:hypothetical protein
VEHVEPRRYPSRHADATDDPQTGCELEHGEDSGDAGEPDFIWPGRWNPSLIGALPVAV